MHFVVQPMKYATTPSNEDVNYQVTCPNKKSRAEARLFFIAAAALDYNWIGR
jgi:hypothetical protein